MRRVNDTQPEFTHSHSAANIWPLPFNLLFNSGLYLSTFYFTLIFASQPLISLWSLPLNLIFHSGLYLSTFYSLWSLPLNLLFHSDLCLSTSCFTLTFASQPLISLWSLPLNLLFHSDLCLSTSYFRVRWKLLKKSLKGTDGVIK